MFLLPEELLAFILSELTLDEIKDVRVVSQAFKDVCALNIYQLTARNGLLPRHAWTEFPCVTHLFIDNLSCTDCDTLHCEDRALPCNSWMARVQELLASLPARVEALTFSFIQCAEPTTGRLAKLLVQSSISISLKQLYIDPALTAIAAARLLRNLPALTDLSINIYSSCYRKQLKRRDAQQCFPPPGCCPHLTSLNLNVVDAPLSHINFDALAELFSRLSDLTLMLETTQVSNAQLQRLFASCSRLCKLVWPISYSFWSDARDAGPVIHQLAALPQLDKLLVEDAKCSVTDLLPAQQLREAKLHTLALTPEQLAEAVLRQEAAEQLQQLHLSDMDLGGRWAPALPLLDGCLAQLLPDLQGLSISGGIPSCTVQQVVSAVAGHPSLTSLDVIDCCHDMWSNQDKWQQLLAQLASCPCLQSASIRLLEEASWGLQQAYINLAQLGGRGFQALAEGACSASLRSLKFFPSLEDCFMQVYSVGMYVGLADAALLLGQGSGLRLQHLSLPVDLGLDVRDLKAGLRLSRHLQQCAAKMASGCASQGGRGSGLGVRGLWACGSRGSRGTGGVLRHAVQTAERAQQKEQQLATVQLVVQQQAKQLQAHLQRMLAAQEVLEALQRAVQGSKEEEAAAGKGLPLTVLYDLYSSVTCRRGRAVRRSAALVRRVAQEVPGLDGVLPQGWQALLLRGLLLRQEVQHSTLQLRRASQFSRCYCRNWHWELGSVAGCEVALLPKM
jgi:hypothetical protein